MSDKDSSTHARVCLNIPFLASSFSGSSENIEPSNNDEAPTARLFLILL